MIINDLYNNKKQGMAEAIGDLGSKRDQGKTIRKWRKSRGLDEQGVVEDANLNYIWIQGDFDGDTASSGATQGSWRDQQSTPVKLTRGRMTNVRSLSVPPPEGGKTIKQAQIPLTLDAGDQKFSTSGVDLQLTVAPNGYVTNGEVGRVRGTAVVKIMRPESVEEDLTRRGFLRGLGAAALAGASGGALAGSNDPSFVGKVHDQHNAMIEKNPRYAKEHDALGIYIARGIAGASAENNKRWVEKTAKLLQKYGVNVNEGMAEDDDAVAAFLARGGEVQKLKPARPRKGERWQGSAHIGAAGGRGTKGRVSGLAANTGKSGKPVVTAEQGVSEVSLGDYRKKAAVNKAVAQANRFFDRDDPAKVAAADQTIAKREKGLARADARVKPYTPPAQDAEKMQRDLTAKYPNIDELVAAAEQRRDPNYDYAEGNAYYDGREAEQNYQKLKQIQRVIQGLNESKIKENKMKLNEAILNEDPIYRTWKTLGRTLVERRMSEKEILQVFADAESGMTDKATGANRTMLGRGKDTTMDFAGQVKDAVSGVLNSIQNSVPVAAVDVAYDQATDALANLAGGQKGKVMQAIKGYRNLVKQYPKTAGFAKAALVAIAGLATGGAGLPAVAGLTYALDSSIRGDKLSSVIGKGAGAAFMTWLATQIGSANAADTKPVGPGYHDPVYDAPEITPDLATYTAKSGDTLSQIAKDNGTTVRDIVGLNPQLAAASGAKGGQMLNPDVIFPGQEITLPAAGGENIYSGGMGTNADTMAQIGRDNMPNSAITQRMAMRESLKFVTLPVDRLIDRELTAMAWVVNESMYSNKQRGVWLTQAGTYAVFENIDRYRLALMEKAGVPGSTRPEYYRPDMSGGPGKASKPGIIGRGLNWLDQKTKAVGGALSNFGHQFTTDVTKEKLKMNWHQAGKPSDSNQLAAWLVTQGVPQQVVSGVFKKMNIPYIPNAEPQATEPQATKPQATGPKTKELGTGTGRINPATGRPWTPSELKAKYAQPQPTAPTPEPGPAPATTTPSGPPGFNAGNLAQLPGMAQYMQQKPAAPKPAANYGQSPAAYGKTTMSVGPTATKSTTAAPAGKKPTTQQQQEYYKSLGLAEDLSWSKNFDPGRSLYRQIKQES